MTALNKTTKILISENTIYILPQHWQDLPHEMSSWWVSNCCDSTATGTNIFALNAAVDVLPAPHLHLWQKSGLILEWRYPSGAQWLHKLQQESVSICGDSIPVADPNSLSPSAFPLPLCLHSAGSPLDGISYKIIKSCPLNACQDTLLQWV